MVAFVTFSRRYGKFPPECTYLYAKVLIRRYFSEGACRSVRAINRTGDQTAPIKSSNIAFCFSKWFDWKVNFFK